MQEPAKSSQPPTSGREAEHALRSRVLGRVLSGAVHDIRTPLGTMVMKLQLLRDGASEGGLPEQIAQHLRVLDAQVERVTEMLRKMASTVEPPSPLGWVDLAALLGDLAGQLAEVERGSALDEALHDLLATMACHAAVRANQEVSAEEARALLDGLDAIDFKARCPHGRPVVFELPLAELERRVGRR